MSVNNLAEDKKDEALEYIEKAYKCFLTALNSDDIDVYSDELSDIMHESSKALLDIKRKFN